MSNSVLHRNFCFVFFSGLVCERNGLRPENLRKKIFSHVQNMPISPVILLPEKFLPFDGLRAEVFQLNLKYLLVKITVTMVTPNFFFYFHQIIWSHELRKNGGKISRF